MVIFVYVFCNNLQFFAKEILGPDTFNSSGFQSLFSFLMTRGKSFYFFFTMMNIPKFIQKWFPDVKLYFAVFHHFPVIPFWIFPSKKDSISSNCKVSLPEMDFTDLVFYLMEFCLQVSKSLLDKNIHRGLRDFLSHSGNK